MLTKILLINPPFEDFYQTEIRQQPTGLKYIQASLEKAGYQTFLLDCLSTKTKQTIRFPYYFEYLTEFYPTNDLSPFKLFTHFRRFGMTMAEIADYVLNLKPDLIGISINVTPYCETAIETAKLCKTLFPQTPIIAGGHHAAAVPESVLKSNFIDFVILGEGEQRFVRLIELLSSGNFRQLEKFTGIAYKNKRDIIIKPPVNPIQNLDEIPFPEINENIGMILTSRGCPQNCNFCSVARLMGKKVRLRLVKSVIKEIEMGIQNGVRKFDFEDDNLTINRNRSKTLFKEIKNRFDKYHLHLSAMNGIMADSVDEELIQLMKQAGFEWLNIPLVSGSSEVQQKINRFQSRQQFLRVIEWAQKHQLKVVAYIILGLPEDNLDQMMDDIIFLTELPVLIGPSIFYPPPGSKTYLNCVKKKIITGVDYSLYRSTAIPVETKNFSRKDIITLFRIVRLVNYLKQHCQTKLAVTNNDNEEQINSSSLVFDHRLTQHEIGKLIIDDLISGKNFRGICFKRHIGEFYQYQWIDYRISQNLVNDFLVKMSEIKTIGFRFDLP